MNPSKLSKNLFFLFAVSTLLLTSCSRDGPGNQQDLANALSQDDVFTTEQAECIAEKVFAEYGDDKDAVEKISAADDIADIETGENKVDGFNTKYASFLKDCTS